MDEVTILYEKALIGLQENPKLTRNLTLEDEKISELYECGFLFPLVERDQDACRVLLYQLSSADPKHFEFEDYFRLVCLIGFTLLEAPEVQINGLSVVMDCKNLIMELISLFPLRELLNFVQHIQNTVPVRIKKIVLVNLPSIATAIAELLIKSMNKKISKRVTICSTNKELFEKFDQRIFPKEYGGVVPMTDMQEDYKIHVKAKTETV